MTDSTPIKVTFTTLVETDSAKLAEAFHGASGASGDCLLGHDRERIG
jgi:hypothetical protein